ncbi:MAG: 2-amino-4-hydroxy-6-hydroxymethyldihydropteridine diphosphokinase [Flavobacteriaceae bacterium]|nr:MAG: 2-amino-4-hydroxy-6-hydroxymethyldihydropteridine diphosphokinase [Flavobacteriaceae bacterium]
MKIQQTIYLSLGSNLQNRLKSLQKAVYLIHEEIGSIQKISSVYKTTSLGFKGHDFFNICLEVATCLTPEIVMKIILAIEKELGRKRTDSTKYTNRIIDIDILLFGNEVIFSKHITIPHPEMLERKFVLAPLEEIAKQVIHPVVKKQITYCLQDFTDTSEIHRIPEKLERPVAISETYKYIAIEGNIGAGKTSLAQLIARDFNAKLVLERFADNPFLPKFYKNKERFAFPLEMSFLADRYQQLTDDLAQFDLFKNFVVSDYYMFKSLIFAQITLPNDEYALYRKMFDLMYKEIPKPDLYIYLYQNTDCLLKHIKKRGRDYEQHIKPEYLQKIHNGYSNFMKTKQHLNTLIIDVSELDFVKEKEHYKHIICTIEQHKQVSG